MKLFGRNTLQRSASKQKVKESQSARSPQMSKSGSGRGSPQTVSRGEVQSAKGGELEQQFDQLLNELGIQGEKREKMLAFPTDMKWTLIQQNKEGSSSQKRNENDMTPEAAVDVLTKSGGCTVKELDQLRVLLGCSPVPWVEEFLDKGGLNGLLSIEDRVISMPNPHGSDMEALAGAIRCMKAAMNAHYAKAIDLVISNKKALQIQVRTLQLVDTRLAIGIVDMLTAISISSDQMPLLLASQMTDRVIAKLVSFLTIGEINLQVSIMTLVNATMSGLNLLQADAFRRRFEGKGLLDVLKKIRGVPNDDTQATENLEMQLDIYADAKDDQDEDTFNLGSPRVNPKELFSTLFGSIKGTDAEQHFSRLLETANNMRMSGVAGAGSWELLVSFVRALTLIDDASVEGESNEEAVRTMAVAASDSLLLDLDLVHPRVRSAEKSLAEVRAQLDAAKEGGSAQLQALSAQLEAAHAEVRQATEKADASAAVAASAEAERDEFKTKLAAMSAAKEAAEQTAAAASSGSPSVASPSGTESDVQAPVAADSPASAAPDSSASSEAEMKALKEEVAALKIELETLRAKAKETAGGDGDGSTSDAPAAAGDSAAAQAGEAAAAPAPAAPAPPAPPPPGAAAPPPPPPPGGAAPGAPPPPPGMGGAVAKKPVIKPGCKMRAFNWTKVPPVKAKKTVWATLSDEDALAKLDKSKFEATFGLVQSDKSKSSKSLGSASGGGGGGGAKKPESPLDAKRAQNLSIGLSRFKIPPAELRVAIMHVDPRVVSLENVKALRMFGPQADDAELLKPLAEAPQGSIGKAETFLLEMLKVPRYDSRMEELSFYTSFKPRSNSALSSLGCLRKALGEVRESKKLRRVLECVLAVGNYMNGSTFRGGAFGFTLDSLGKLADVKAASGDTRFTLIHFVSEFVEKNFPDAANLGADFPTLVAASKESLNQLGTDVGQLVKMHASVSAAVAVDMEAGDSTEWQHFNTTMATFVDDAQSRLNTLNEGLEKFKEQFKDAVVEYAADETGDSEAFFGSLCRFVGVFERSKKDRVRWAEEAKKGTGPGARGSGRSPGKPAPFNPLAGKGGQGALDSLLAGLKSGKSRRT